MAQPAVVALVAALAVCVGLLYYVYDGYLRVLLILDRLRPAASVTCPPGRGQPPSITVVIAVFNEAHQIVDRVRNILDQDYPQDLVEVVVASDGSTDDVAGLVARSFGDNVRLVLADDRLGKSAVQNRAVATIHSAILVFTDASTRFDPGFLAAVAAPFGDPSVGAVQGHLLFGSNDPAQRTTNQGRYWATETRIRRLESRRDILAVSSGACIAVRRELWRPLDADVGEDCLIPLDVVLQSKRVVFAESAVAVEPTDDELTDLISNRSRMTLRNWQGTWRRSALLNPVKYPGYAFALWSHKLLRWMSPIWLLVASLSALALPFVTSRPLWYLPAAAVLFFYFLGAVGGVASRNSRHVPVCGAIYAFILANLGFLSGLARAARGDAIRSYR